MPYFTIPTLKKFAQWEDCARILCLLLYVTWVQIKVCVCMCVFVSVGVCLWVWVCVCEYGCVFVSVCVSRGREGNVTWWFYVLTSYMSKWSGDGDLALLICDLPSSLPRPWVSWLWQALTITLYQCDSITQLSSVASSINLVYVCVRVDIYMCVHIHIHFITWILE